MNQRNKKRMIVCGSLVVIVVALGLWMWLSDFGYHAQPMYEVDTYDEFVDAMKKVKNPCVIPSRNLFEEDANYVILLADRFHNTPSGYGVSSSDYKSGVGCKWLDTEESETPFVATGSYGDVEIAEFTADTGAHHIQFLLGGYLYSVDAPTADEAMALARAIIDQK